MTSGKRDAPPAASPAGPLPAEAASGSGGEETSQPPAGRDRSASLDDTATDLHFRDLSRADEVRRAPLRALVPLDALADGSRLHELLGSVVAEYDDIERALAALREDTGKWQGPWREAASAVVSEAELLDPVSLQRALLPLQSEAARFELLFARATAALQRLDAYALSQRPAAEVVEAMSQEQNQRALQYAVEFLISLRSAADSFEQLELPGPHIREYLEHLYRMEDWQEMRRLVRLLQVAVRRCLRVQQEAPGTADAARAGERQAALDWLAELDEPDLGGVAPPGPPRERS